MLILVRWLGMDPNMVKTLRSTVKLAGDTSGSNGFIMEQPGSLAGYPVAVTQAIASDVEGDSPFNERYVIFGAWSQLIVGYWSGLWIPDRISVAPETARSL